MNRELFTKAVAKVLDELPDEFLARMENVELVVEDFPVAQTLSDLGLCSKWDLLGLYEGEPEDRKSFFGIPGLPARITLFRMPILRAAPGPWAVAREVREVLLHELGHHLGFDEKELQELEGRSE